MQLSSEHVDGSSSSSRLEIVVDGMNVAMSNIPSYENDGQRRRQYALSALEMCLNYFVRLGVSVKVIAPMGFVDAHRPEIEIFERAGLLFVSPGGLDDNFLLQQADANGAFIVSNDRFTDHIRDRGYDPDWIEYHRVPFMFNPDFSPEPDALVRMQQMHQGLTPIEFGSGFARIHPPKLLLQKKAPSMTPPSIIISIQETTLIVPRPSVGRIIGKGGSTIKSLQIQYNVRINVTDGPGAHESTVTITSTSRNHTNQNEQNRNAAADAIAAIAHRATTFPSKSRFSLDDDSHTDLRSKRWNHDRAFINSSSTSKRRGSSLPPPNTNKSSDIVTKSITLSSSGDHTSAAPVHSSVSMLPATYPISTFPQDLPNQRLDFQSQSPLFPPHTQQQYLFGVSSSNSTTARAGSFSPISSNRFFVHGDDDMDIS